MAEENQSTNGDGAGAQSLLSSLKNKEVVIPAVATAASVIVYAARKGASDAKGKLEGEAEKLGEEGAEGAKKGLGGKGAALGKLASKAIGGGGDGGGGAKKTRRLPIQRYTDIAAPVGTVYEKWTEFEEFPNFMHRVLNVKQEDDKVVWDEKIWFSTRRWAGEITERKRNKRIAWRTTSGMAHAGVVTFHRLDDDLTRVMVDIDFVPQGIVEKMASGLRFVKRAVQADLARFKAYVELGQAEELEYHAKPAEREGEGTQEDEPRSETDGEGRESEKREEQPAASS